jgi:hypothetical protein
MSAIPIRIKESQLHHFESETAGDGERPRQSHLSIGFLSKLNNRNTTRNTQQGGIVLPRSNAFALHRGSWLENKTVLANVKCVVLI